MRKNLAKERKKKRLTQIQVAQKVGITERHYQTLEAGTSKGSMDVWEQLKTLFGKPIDYLYENTLKE